MVANAILLLGAAAATGEGGSRGTDSTCVCVCRGRMLYFSCTDGNEQTNRRVRMHESRLRVEIEKYIFFKFPYLFFFAFLAEDGKTNFFLQYLVNTEKQHPHLLVFFSFPG